MAALISVHCVAERVGAAIAAGVAQVVNVELIVATYDFVPAMGSSMSMKHLPPLERVATSNTPGLVEAVWILTVFESVDGPVP